jgi:hypothetical protein
MQTCVDKTKSASILGRCGHEEQVKCGKAFELANKKSHCNVRVPTACLMNSTLHSFRSNPKQPCLLFRLL